MMRIFAMIISLMTTVFSATNFYAAEKGTTSVVELQDTTHRFGRVNEGEVVTHDFKIFNRGEAVLEIKQVEPG